MNVLDSRFLRLGDCFGQKFSRAGNFKYIVTTGAGSCLPVGESAYTISVKPSKVRDGKGGQHNVAVRQQGMALEADPAQIEIETGDMILWQTPDAITPGFAVVGEGEAGEFSSSALAFEAVYSHAFGSPGRYHGSMHTSVESRARLT
jgi:plastocyanin